MKFTMPVLIASAVVLAAIAVAPAADAQPTTLEALCAAQTWPRPVPDVVGLAYQPYSKRISWDYSGGALACWDDIRGVTADGGDARRSAGGWNTIASISPPPGTLVERNQPLTVHVAAAPHDAPPSAAPCDWVSTADVAEIFGFSGDVVTDAEAPPGSVEPSCAYRDPGRTVVLSRLLLPGAFAVDAAGDYALYPREHATQMPGLGVAAQCLRDLEGSQGSRYNQVVVLLENNTIVEVQGLGGQPCDQLARFARKTVEGVSAHTATPCSDGQVQVTSGGERAAAGHRGVTLVFSLTPEAHECTLTGYPGVDSGTGGPLIHATRTMAGYMGGLRDTSTPPTVLVTATTPAHAVVEGDATDSVHPDRPCPTYTEIVVTAPDTTTSVSVPRNQSAPLTA